MKSLKGWLVILAIILAGSIPALAQTNVNEEKGMKPYDAWHGGDLDSVSMTNGGLVLHIPLVSFPQRGNLDLTFSVYANTKQWATWVNPVECANPNDPAGCTPMWKVSPRGASVGFGNAPLEAAYVTSTLDWIPQNNCTSDSDLEGHVTYNWSSSLTAPDGNSHSFGSADTAPGCAGPPLRALDASGILMSDNNTIIFPNGTRFSFANSLTPSAFTDANGNQITINSNTGAYNDTMGRSITPPVLATASDVSGCPSGTASAKAWTVPGLAGGTRTFKFCYSTVSIFTTFGQGATEYGPTNNTLLTAIVLPDATMWTFAYDHYGDVTRLGFPTGGSISYTYATGPVLCDSLNSTPISMMVTSRTVDANDGTGGHTWTYTYTAPTSTAAGSMVVTSPSPDFNDTVHSVGDPITGVSSCSLYDLQVQNYQGSHSGGTLLKTAATQYSANPNTLGTVGGASAINVVPAQTSVTWRDGHSSKVVNTWDSGNSETPYNTAVPLVLGSLLQRDEYDYSNTLVRTMKNHYLWQDNATYKSSNLLALKVSSTTCTQPTNCNDGTLANRMAQITYGYDETAVTPSGITTGLVAPPAGGNIRGNQTTVSHWLNTTNSFLSSTATYLDTGMAASSTPPLNADGHNRTTTYTYSSTFFGAYMTQTNMPDTLMPDTGATVVHHVISGNYDFNTGLLTSFTDENGQIYNYQYDSTMLRLTEGDHPDGGKTLFTYPSPTQVERRRLIGGPTYPTTYDDYKVNFDGLGRSIQSQEATPSGTILADTTYDTVGRVSTVSNPYYQGSTHSSDPTYGVTTTQYDALNRAIKTTKQDGSFSTVQYNAPADAGDNGSVICTTATDDAGKQRQVCSDALGRMVRVMEPNPGSTITTATGWLAVSGSEQSSGGQPATSGSVSVTLDGSEQEQTDPFIVWDTGTVSITVNGHTDSVNYGRTDTPSTLASALTSAINGDSGAPVTASLSGTTITLTAKTTGAVTNYAFTAGATTNDPTDFGGSGFFFDAPATGNLAGGHDATAGTSDTGTVQATINGTAYTVSYGAGDTPSTIASRLATAISAGSFASASASGSMINLTSKTAGAGGNYSLAASYTWNSGTFSNPSFTTSTSGGSLSGGYNPADLGNNPYVTTYQYNVRSEMLCVHQKATDTTADVACTGPTPPAVPAAWHQRFFTYNSLSQLLTALNPEAGQTSFQYDADGNMTSKTSPAPNQTGTATVTTSVTYDALNRPLDKTYSDGTTPNAAYRYDYSSFWGAPTNNPIGRMVATTGAMGTVGYIMSYDPMGRVKQTWQCTPGVSGCSVFSENYDDLGDPLSVGFPAGGFSVTYSYDTAARLTGASDSNSVTYAQTPTYWASGAMREFSSPNFNNNKFHADYNSRLQPTEIWAGPAEGATALFDKQYSYNAPNTTQMNNGNIYTVTNVKDDNRTQSFTYDPLNRLLTAGDKTHWANSYAYDAWGNLYQKNKGTLPGGENMQKVADTNNRLSGMTYDAAGNVIVDDQGNTMVYDAENRIISVTNSLTGTTTYTYDSLGRRIRKVNGATATNYWFGPGGQTLAETDASGNWTNYIFFGGQRLARNVSGDIKYYITDHLHSTAVFADKSGAVLDDYDYNPWGGLAYGTSTSNNHYKFTGKERDAESGLDYFGARYYANVTGRFMSPDWAGKPTSVPYAEFGDPQSLNLYSYVRNSPIVRVDPDGHNYAGMNGLNRDDTAGLPTADEDTKDPTAIAVDNSEQKAELMAIADAADAAVARDSERGLPRCICQNPIIDGFRNWNKDQWAPEVNVCQGISNCTQHGPSPGNHSVLVTFTVTYEMPGNNPDGSRTVVKASLNWVFNEKGELVAGRGSDSLGNSKTLNIGDLVNIVGLSETADFVNSFPNSKAMVDKAGQSSADMMKALQDASEKANQDAIDRASDPH